LKKISYKILAFVLSLVTVLSVLNLTGFSLQAGNFIYVISGTDAKITGLSDTSVSGKLEIPSTLGGYNTATIGAYAFSDCDKITSITVPASVKTLETHAFAYCNNLQTVSIASGVTSIGVAAFFDCDKLQTITVDSANSVFSSDNGILFNKNKTELVAFPKCKEIESYTVPAAVKVIGKQAFNSSKLKTLVLQNGIKEIHEEAFSYSNIYNFTFPKSIEYIGEDVLSYYTVNVGYIGTEAEWNNITIHPDNENLEYATEEGTTTTVKFFVWDGIDTMVPLVEAVGK